MPIGKTALVRIRINANSQIGIVIVTEIKCRHTQCMLELYFYKKRQRRYALYFQKKMYIRECYGSTLANVTLVA